jgi:hypothetical protein
MYAKPKPGI